MNHRYLPSIISIILHSFTRFCTQYLYQVVWDTCTCSGQLFHIWCTSLYGGFFSKCCNFTSNLQFFLMPSVLWPLHWLLVKMVGNWKLVFFGECDTCILWSIVHFNSVITFNFYFWSSCLFLLNLPHLGWQLFFFFFFYEVNYISPL